MTKEDIRKIRQHNKLNIYSMARKIGVTERYVSQMERGTSKVTENYVQKINALVDNSELEPLSECSEGFKK